MKHLFIDYETYSETDIKSAGNYKYCEDENFQILLCGYIIFNEIISPSCFNRKI